MNTRIRIIPWVMLVVGFILLSAGVAELYPLCRAARNCHHTVGIVQSKPRRITAIVNSDTILR